MKLGILITAYNEEPRIKKVLNKLTNKTVILVNDGSTDGTENIIDSYDNVIKISYKKNQGKGYACLLYTSDAADE